MADELGVEISDHGGFYVLVESKDLNSPWVPNSSIPSHPAYSSEDAVVDPLKEPPGLPTSLDLLIPGSWERSKPKAADYLLTLPPTTGLGSGAEPRAKGSS